MDRFSKTAMIGLGLFVAGIVLVTGLRGNGTDAESQSRLAAEKANTGPDPAADIPNTKVATILGRDIFRKDLEPPAKWLEDREKYLKLRGETSGLVPLDTYRLNKLYDAIWKPLTERYIHKPDVEPTEEELQEFIVHHRQVKERTKQDWKDKLKQLPKQAEELEKQLPTQDSEDQEQTSQQLRKIREEIGAIEKSLEIERSSEGKGEKFEQFFAKWWVGNWKQHRWFYKRYGGRVIYQQVGPQAVDAMRDFLREAEAKKDFVIYDQELNAKFWAPYTRANPGVIVPNPDKVFEHPWSISDSSVNGKPPSAPASSPAAKGQPAVTAKTIIEGASVSALPVELSLEDNAKAEISISLEGVKQETLQQALPGTVQLDLRTAGDGQHHLFFQCPGYASQWAYIEIAGGKVSLRQIKIKLFRSRYVILRCAFNMRGGRNLDGDGVKEQRIALPHWAAPKYFSQDWQIWQRTNGGDEFFGDTPYLDFHRNVTGFGFARPAKGVSFEEMKEAPEAGYLCKNTKATKGLALYCRVNGNRAEGLGYGKLLVEDVTETRPKDVRVVEVRE